MFKLSRGLLLVLMIWLAGCYPSSAAITTQMPQAVITATKTAAPIVLSNANQTLNAPASLLLWLPPQFDPSADTQAAKIFQAQLDEFRERRGVNIRIRIKGLEGEGGMINALATTSAAAPLVMPDLVALPRAVLEDAAYKGLLYPLDEYLSLSSDTDWFDYARQLGHVQESTFGIPFAGDALIMHYRPSLILKPPRDWQAVLQAETPLLFAAAEPQAFFTLAQYTSAGGATQDEVGRPKLDLTPLTNVLMFFEQSQANEKMPFWLTQFDTDQEAWQAYLGGQSAMVVSWTSNFLSSQPKDTMVTFMPTMDGEEYSLASGWVWAVTSPDASRRSLSVELAEFLVTSDFSGRWSESAGYLPVRPSALASWRDTTLGSFFHQVGSVANLAPPSDIIAILGPLLQEATVKVLKRSSNANNAAQETVNKLQNP